MYIRGWTGPVDGCLALVRCGWVGWSAVQMAVNEVCQTTYPIKEEGRKGGKRKGRSQKEEERAGGRGKVERVQGP